MFRTSYNRAVLRVRVDTITPLRIGAGDIGLDPTGADLTCVRTRHGSHGTTVYIPGSGLKGVIRAAAEASVRGRKLAGVAGACDDPLEHKDKDRSCGARYQSDAKTPTHTIHAAHCLACRLFGSQAIKGRASIRDLFPWFDDAGPGDRHVAGGENHTSANRLELRHGVAIDRLLGSVKNGPFDQELVPAGVSFFGDIAIENYQVCQLGLLAQVFDQFDTGLAQLGSSKSRGLGVARITVERIIHEQAGRRPQPCGVGDLATADECKAYGLLAESALPPADGIPHGLAMRFDVRESAAWLTAGRTALGALL
jgi:CRISPR-associated RAMP protein (TIGR02581 family)